MRVRICVSLLALAVPASVAAQSRPPVARPAAAAQFDPRATVAEVRRIIAERYVLPERRPALDAVLAEGLSSGRYIVTDPSVLAERVNADLARVGHDRHLNFNYSPRAASEGPRRQQGPSPEEADRESRSRNYGVRELRVLPGNVRYMGYDGFDWTSDETPRALETAMRFLSGGDAVIIDLRRNGGGSPEAVQYIVSHFMAPNRPLMTFYMNGAASPDTTATLADVPAGRMVGKPLYVLISGSTASAAEEFAGHVAGYHLGELVGENTAGAGFRNDLVRLDGGFVLSVSVGRAVLAATGKDWEAVGHAPNIPSPVAGALDAAHSAALRRLAQNAAGPERERMIAIADAIAARAERRTPALAYAAYAGTFGERKIIAEGNRLLYQRGERTPEPLISLGGNVFVFENNPAMRIEFTPAGTRTTAFAINPAGLPSQGTYERTQ